MIHKGEKVYRRNGALLGMFIKDVVEGDRLSSEHFEYYDGSRPGLGQVVDEEIMAFVHSKRKTEDE